MKKMILCLLFLLTLSLNVLAIDETDANETTGFDGGGGPGHFAELIMGFLGSVNKNLVSGCFLESYEEDKIILSTTQKSADEDDSVWERLIDDKEKQFIVMVVGLMENPGRPLYLAIEFDEFKIVDGNLVLNFEEGIKAYLYDVNRNSPQEIDFYEFYNGICEGGCPDIHFLIPNRDK